MANFTTSRSEHDTIYRRTMRKGMNHLQKEIWTAQDPKRDAKEEQRYDRGGRSFYASTNGEVLLFSRYCHLEAFTQNGLYARETLLTDRSPSSVSGGTVLAQKRQKSPPPGPESGETTSADSRHRVRGAYRRSRGPRGGWKGECRRYGGEIYIGGFGFRNIGTNNLSDAMDLYFGHIRPMMAVISRI